MGERGSRWAVAAPPIVFESEDLVDSFSEFILNAHEEIQAKSGCFEFSLSVGARASAHGKSSPRASGESASNGSFAARSAASDIVGDDRCCGPLEIE